MTAGDDEGLDRLGDTVDRYISEQGWQYIDVAGRAGFSDETLAKIRKGIQVRPSTYRRLERALGWAPMAVSDVRAGRPPALLAAEAEEASSEEPLDPQAEAVLAILAGLPPRVREQVRRRLGDQLPPEARRSA
ncbi:helix-turn-helix domain-containing protein [Streptomyces sp. NPDC014861]|uniref:helix-turn-helix domain-containing protein n=1 Tax=Streptomyces sp. NPDC014861 TaxID=3364923 RepID=UPI0036F969AC